MKKYLEVDIHVNHPTVNEAMEYFEEVFDNSLYNNLDYLIIICGYGSVSGKHKIKDALIKKLKAYQKDNYIKKYFTGDELVDSFGFRNLSIDNKYLVKLDNKELKTANPGKVYIFFK